MDKMIATVLGYINKYTKIEDEELFSYGLSSLIKYILFFIILIPICIYLNNLKESCLFLILFITIRIHVGGYHLKSAFSCLIVSIALISIIPYLILQFPLDRSINWILFFLGSCILIKYAPVEHTNKKISASEYQYFRKQTKVILFIYLLLLLLSELTDYSNLATIITFSIFINALNVLIALIKRRK